MINHYKSNELYFSDMATDMVNDLTHSTGSNVSVYSVDGELLASSDEAAFLKKSDEDLKEAISGNTAYHIIYDRSKAEALFHIQLSLTERK